MTLHTVDTTVQVPGVGGPRCYPRQTPLALPALLAWLRRLPCCPRLQILTFPDTLTTQGLSLWCFNIVGGEILTFPDTLTTQGLSLDGVST